MSMHRELGKSKLFRDALYDFTLPSPERHQITFNRAEAIARSSNYTLKDVYEISEHFWLGAIDPLVVIDVAAYSTTLIQFNLATGTLSAWAHRPEIAELCRQLLNWEVSSVLLNTSLTHSDLVSKSGHFLLTEVAHGLDTQNIETTATQLPDGGFDLHTPHPGAAKFMPCTTPVGGIPRVAVVMARLIANGKFHGVRPFFVPLNDGKGTMNQGITSRGLPDRAGTRPMGNGITTFTHVHLPATAFLGDWETTLPPRIHLLASIWRLGIGTTTLAGLAIPALRVAAHVTADFARQRQVTDSGGKTVPILSFRTTGTPIVKALGQAAVLEAFYRELRPYYAADPKTGKHTLTVDAINMRNFALDGVQNIGSPPLAGNKHCLDGSSRRARPPSRKSIDAELRGMAIAEGDVLVLCIRLATEYLLGRYALPPPRYPDSPLAKHEKGIYDEMRDILVALGSDHRSAAFNSALLPRSVPLVLAIGQRMAYEAALDAGVDSAFVRLYVSSGVLQDLAWYTESGLTTRVEAIKAEESAITEALDIMEETLDKNGCAPLLHAPILSQSAWTEWVDTLPLHRSKL
ncbi:Acyl-CoA dehydrogenase NM domain-like protein [Mycena indigotica]|uniref:Acyl-CoA dehydrogenase NM domain-like protein n=1 Tax=Mycena indigotica TaxID=2126181 RepID=A0A8H6VR72_9AGAR|nr:Acyl-CoA dehydrogenase NM domain-like protein [Mycena indigotica]KAF7289006.1 Acyl-CoA dehydrogenase NM domain-like protein [Mycena indigotica]